MGLTAVEFCAGGGGQALGLENAGFDCAGAIEIDRDCCATLRLNRPWWDVRQDDMREIDGRRWSGVDLLAAGVPCPPFSIAGKQIGAGDDRDMFPSAVRLIREVSPNAIMIENVPGFASSKFDEYRNVLLRKLKSLGYEVEWRVLQASSFGVPQLRPRFVLVGLKPQYFGRFSWPIPLESEANVSGTIGDLMAERGWKGVDRWKQLARRIAPTIVGGSKKHGGPDLGPTRARKQWLQLGVDGSGVADLPPSEDFESCKNPKLTVKMVARIQGFPDHWQFWGKKTAAYRQVGNAFPPPVAEAVGRAIAFALYGKGTRTYSTASTQGQLTLLEASAAYGLQSCSRKPK